MIRMTRVRLVNWHNFTDSILDIKMITYLIGVNAVGKTTIMDAVRYCLTTNKNFNTAGNRRSERTLQGSVHGKQRAVKVYTRPGHTVSYIGVEFYDEIKQKPFVITVRVESENPAQELRHVSQDWYLTKPGYNLEQLPYIIKNRPASREQFRLSGKGLEMAPNQTEARRRISRILGIGEADSPLGKKFHEVFHMGTSLEDINNIREFIYTYILPEPEMNLETLQGDMRELERLSEVLMEAQQREKSLQEIIDCLDEGRRLDGRVRVVELLLEYARWQEAVEKDRYCELEITRNQRISVTAGEELKALEERKSAITRKRDEVIRNLGQNPENQALTYLQEKEDELKKQCRELRTAKDKLDRAVSMLKQLDEQLKIQNFVLGISDEITNTDISLEERKEQIHTLAAGLKQLEPEIKERGHQIWASIETAKQELKGIGKHLLQLKSGKMVYPKDAEKLKQVINSELQKRGMPEEARIFCELLYMTDESWQDTVESYLGSQRFYVLVPPRYYQVAKEVFVRMGQEVGHAGLVDTIGLERDYHKAGFLEGDFLAGKIESKNPYARMYIIFLLKDTVCCEHESDLEQYRRSVTRDLLRYQNYCLIRMDKREHYIGLNARKQQIDVLEERQNTLLTEKRHSENSKVELERLEQLYYPFVQGNAMEDLYQHLDAPERLEETEQQRLNVRKEIEEYEKNPILRAMFNQIDCLKNELEDLDKECVNKQASQQTADQTILKMGQEQEKNRDYIQETRQQYESLLHLYSEYQEDALARYEEYAKTRSPAEIVKNQINSNALAQLQSRRDNYINTILIPEQNDYNSHYACDYAPGLAGDGAFRMAHASLVNIDLEKYKEDLRQAQIRCEARFRKDVLFRLKDDITTAKQQIKSLNRVMENLAYGEEQYRFHVDGCKEGELKAFYNIIIAEKNEEYSEDSQLSFFTDTRDEAYETQVHDFMERIMVDAKEIAQARAEGKKAAFKPLSQYVDYRTYLDYDMYVKNLSTGYEVPLSEVSGDGSGGENQAPFYVAICASFLQIYEQSENSIRLILLDEAFNKMTSDRIAPMMKMFRDLKMQVLLISTVEKCSSIYPYCDLTYSILKVGNRNSIGLFDREQI